MTATIPHKWHVAVRCRSPWRRSDGLAILYEYELESRRAINRLLTALVPALTILMTALVAIVMAAMLLPLRSSTRGIQ